MPLKEIELEVELPLSAGNIGQSVVRMHKALTQSGQEDTALTLVVVVGVNGGHKGETGLCLVQEWE